MKLPMRFCPVLGRLLVHRLILLALAKKPQKTAKIPQFRFRNL